MFHSILDRPFIGALALAILLAAPLSAAPPGGDQILIYQDGVLAQAPLPGGPALPAAAVANGIVALLPLPSGQVLAMTLTPVSPLRTILSELLPDGSLRPIGLIDPVLEDYHSAAFDLALDSRGRIFAAIAVYSDFPPDAGGAWLAEIDPATAATLSSRKVEGLGLLATAPAGLWSVTSSGGLFKLDPDTLSLSPSGLSIAAPVEILDIETDSAGRLWYLARPAACAPPCNRIGSLDPATGISGEAPAALYQQTPAMREMAIRRACFESSTTRCLAGGRFRAEIEYRAYDGAAGAAQAAPARSRDTGVFSFFDPDNWELMVKVLDGCAINAHFWVYASASTDVEYTMTITDTETGAQKVYRNPLGQVARTVTDGQAFPCSF